jgi:hypothetical protein
MIDEIDNYEKESIQHNEINNEFPKMFQQLVDELDKFNSKTSQYLKNLNLNDENLIDSNKEAVVLREKAELEIQDLKDFIFNDNIMNFETNKGKLMRSILDEIKITKSFEEVMFLCEFIIKQQWDLINRASQEGFILNVIINRIH